MSAEPEFSGEMIDGLFTAMHAYQMSTDACNSYLQQIAESDKADLANIVSIVSIPTEFANGRKNVKFTYPMPWLDHVPSVPDFNNSKCWSGEFCQIKISSGTGQSISINPQWFGNAQSDFELDVNIFFNNGDGGCTATAVNKNTSYSKETYGDFSVSLYGLPQSPWVGNAYAQWKAANLTGFVFQNIGALIGNAVSTISGVSGNIGENDGAAAASIAGGIGGLAKQAGTVMRTIGNARQSGTVVGGGTATDINTAVSLGKYGFQVVGYMCQQYIMASVDDFFDRYGYKVNRLKKINRKSRPLWCYVKCHEVHLYARPGININARKYIEGILCNGVTFWQEGRRIGDFSTPEANKGV